MIELLPARQPLLFQPFDVVTPFSFAQVVEECRAIWFPEIEDDIEVRLAGTSALAACYYHRMGRRRHVIIFHPVLNRPDVPLEVVRFIAKHELTHLVHQDGHSRAFWAHEWDVGPERFAVWSWVYANLGPATRETRWGFRVIRSWRKRMPPQLRPYQPHLPIDDLPWRLLCPEGGAQLRFRPDWAHGPAPMAAGLR